MMRSSILAALVGCAFVLAAPAVNTDPNATVDDTAVLNFALTLEHLENTFYSQGLAKLSAQDFANAGFQPWVRQRFQQIANHEATHVQFLQKALGDKATQPCEYNFPFTDAKSFAALSMALETVGGSAYMGAAQLLSNKNTLTVAASILATESRHAGWVASAVEKGSAWNGAFETPVGPNGIFSLAGNFIKSCPSSNPALPVQPLPALTLNPAAPSLNQQATVSFDVASTDSNKQLYLAYFNGLEIQYSDVQKSGDKYTTTIPGGLEGVVYAGVVGSKDAALPTDAALLSGLVILDFPLPSAAKA